MIAKNIYLIFVEKFMTHEIKRHLNCYKLLFLVLFGGKVKKN